MRELTIVVAMDKNGLIGKDGGLPWHLPEDLAHFKKVTTSGLIHSHDIASLIMGRKTWDSIGRMLHRRKIIVTTRGPISGYPAGVKARNGFYAALRDAERWPWCSGGIFVVGGTYVYKQALPIATRMFITEVKGEYTGDTYFPDYDKSLWEVVKASETANATYTEYRKVQDIGAKKASLSETTYAVDVPVVLNCHNVEAARRMLNKAHTGHEVIFCDDPDGGLDSVLVPGVTPEQLDKLEYLYHKVSITKYIRHVVRINTDTGELFLGE